MSEFTTLEEHMRGLSWRMRIRVWFARRKIRRWLREGWRPRIYDCCAQCLHPIAWNDDAGVCTKCGGLNSRISFTSTPQHSETT